MQSSSRKSVPKVDASVNGLWHGRRVGGKPGDLYGTSVGCFILAMPNRYLPILQEGKIEGSEETIPVRMTKSKSEIRIKSK